MTFELEGKVALVTGAGSSGPGIGVGRAIAIVLARAGARVVAADVSEAAARETVDLIEAENGEATVFSADLTVSENCSRAVEETIARYGQLDCQVNNVAITETSGSTATLDEDDWDRIMTVNLRPAVMTTKFAVAQMKNGGSIINIGSGSAQRAATGHNAAYTASKGGLAALTRLWAVEFGRRQVRVNCLEPGSIRTPMAERFGHDDERMRFLTHMIPLGTEGTAWDVAFAAQFLASDASRWITGTVLPVDGGMMAATPFWGAQAFSTFEG